MWPPIAPWLFAYRREWLRVDIIAGMTTAAVVIPQAMAYATIAGLPVEAGLYTALAAMLVYPLLGSSRPLSVSTTSAIAMLTAAGVVALSHPLGGDARIIAATLAILVGGILILARMFGLGFVANFISLPVLIGFKAGVGVVIFVGQLKSVLGVPITSATTIGKLLELPGHLTQIHFMTSLIAALGVLVLVALPRALPRLSAPLIWVALSIGLSAVFGLGGHGIKLIGVVPAGLPSLALPDFALAAQLWPAALGIALMSFTESVAAARTFWQRGDTPVNANQELLGVGAANLASALVGGLPAGGGTSQTAIADEAGTRSQMAQWINAAVVLVSLLFLSRAIGFLPQAALGALILVAAISMIRLDDFRAIGRIRRDEMAWALVAMAGVILIGTLQGILVAVVLSFLMLFYQSNHPPVYAVAYNREKSIFRRAGEHEGDETFPGFLILRMEGRLTFANADNTAEKMKDLAEHAQPRIIVLECSAIPDIEYTALMMLIEAERNLRERGIELWLVSLNPDLLKIIERSPLEAALGHERMFIDLHQALEAWFRRRDRTTSTLS